MITNQDVKDALDECIELRWKSLVRNGTERPVPPCSLY